MPFSLASPLVLNDQCQKGTFCFINQLKRKKKDMQYSLVVTPRLPACAVLHVKKSFHLRGISVKFMQSSSVSDDVSLIALSKQRF